MSYREFHYHWVYDLSSSPERLWPFVADTNRFNRDTGVPEIEIDPGKKRLRNARRRVRLSIYGMPIEWEEKPFEWVRPVRFGLDRVYSKGPMAQMKALVELSPRPEGGTRITYDVWARPRNLLGLIAIPLQIGLSSARKFRAAFKKYDELALARSPVNREGSVPQFTDAARQRFNSLRQRLLSDGFERDTGITSSEDKSVEDRLLDFIEVADDVAVARIRPYQLADEWQVSRRAVLETCLRATRVGLLDLQWDLICPLCRGPQESGMSLKDIAAKVHCSTCEIDFAVNFDRFVELTFRPNAAIRSVDVKDYCVGSPQRTPHVVSQQLLPGRTTRRLTLPLESGNYRLRGLELPGAQAITVSAGGESSVSTGVSDKGWSDKTLNISENCSLELQNETDAEHLFILERMIWSDQAATAAEVTALQVFRDLFSTEALRPGEQISVGTLTVLFTDLRNSTRLYREIGDATAFGRVMNHFDVLRKTIAEHDGALVKTIGDAVMAVFRSPASALRAMVEVQQLLAMPRDGGLPLTLKAGLHSGPCIAVTLNDRLDYFGSTVNMAARLEGLSTGSDVIISRAIYDDAEVRELLCAENLSAEPFEMSLKGFDEERFELWRVTRNPQSARIEKI
jgi:class 3 adenylate cyclase